MIKPDNPCHRCLDLAHANKTLAAGKPELIARGGWYRNYLFGLLKLWHVCHVCGGSGKAKK